MTEKRFTIQGVGISDHERKRLYDLQTIDGFISIRDLLNELHEENEQLKKELFEERKDYLIETADISDKLYLDDEIEKERKRIFGDVE